MNRHLRRQAAKNGAPNPILLEAINLYRQRRAVEAIELYRQVLAIDPRAVGPMTNLGACLSMLNQYGEAIDICRRAVEIDPRHPWARHNLGTILAIMGDARAAMEQFRRAAALKPGDWQFARNWLGSSFARDDLDNAELKLIRQTAMAPYQGPVRKLEAGVHSGPLRIGYLSSDLREHPVARNLWAALRHHDKSQCEVFFYVVDQPYDGMTKRFRDLADGWRDLSGIADDRAAGLIRADRIDILVSLAGVIDANRPTICAHRAAPVQISMHDGATSGLYKMDYFLSDPWIAPRSLGEWFSERVVRVPQFYVIDVPSDLPPLRLSTWSRVRFGSFNNPIKLTDATIELWARIFAAVPEADLYLSYHAAYGSEAVRQRQIDRLNAIGIAPTRLVFNVEEDRTNKFLDRYNDVNVALDPMPFGGSTTSFEALSMGVPLVTMPGDTIVSRWGYSMVRALGMPWATDADEYVDLAKRLIAVPQDQQFRDLRRAKLLNSKLVDGARWCRNLERLYRALYRRATR